MGSEAWGHSSGGAAEFPGSRSGGGLWVEALWGIMVRQQVKPFSQTRPNCKPSRGQSGRPTPTILVSQAILLPHDAVTEWTEAARSTSCLRTGSTRQVRAKRGRDGARGGQSGEGAAVLQDSGGAWRVLSRQGTESIGGWSLEEES